MTLTTSRSARSCTGFAVDHSKQTATASIPDEANTFNATNAPILIECLDDMSLGVDSLINFVDQAAMALAADCDYAV